MLKQNPKYAIHSIYKSREDPTLKERDSSANAPIMHREFEVHGEYNFGGLELRGLGWRRVQPLYDEGDEIIAIVKNGVREDPSKIPVSKRYHAKKTIVYSNENAVIIMHIDRKSHHHEIDISLKKFSESNSKYIENTRRLLEHLLGCKLDERKLNGDLLEKIVEN